MPKIIAGNWKMNLSLEESHTLCKALDAIKSTHEIIIFPPFVWLNQMTNSTKNIAIGAQNCAAFDNGAYTGEVSAKMIAQTKASYVLIGHSERRKYFNEKNASLILKVKQALAHNLNIVFCFGEDLEQRKKGEEKNIVKEQVLDVLKDIDPQNYNKIILAYEPIWAIGTGQTATVEQIEAIHTHIKNVCKEDLNHVFKILYGGSCKPSNATQILSTKNVDGVLVGGASLQYDSFHSIIHAV